MSYCVYSSPNISLKSLSLSYKILSLATFHRYTRCDPNDHTDHLLLNFFIVVDNTIFPLFLQRLEYELRKSPNLVTVLKLRLVPKPDH